LFVVKIFETDDDDDVVAFRCRTVVATDKPCDNRFADSDCDGVGCFGGSILEFGLGGAFHPTTPFPVPYQPQENKRIKSEKEKKGNKERTLTMLEKEEREVGGGSKGGRKPPSSGLAR
jgi:hypothetical protein